MMNIHKKHNTRGFTLVETLVAVAIFVGISVAVYDGFSRILRIMGLIRVKEVATNLLNEQFEIVRNLPYASVGTANGIPSGVLLQSQTIVRDNKSFLVETTVRNYDDPFDGTLGGTPNDISPADMKIVEVSVSCALCTGFDPVVFTTRVAPKNLETASTNGALIIRVFDGSGLPVNGAEVTIVNTALSPNINLTDNTGVDGTLTIVDAPPSVDNYQITVTKSGYSIDQTYPVGGSGNPNPTKPNASVILQQITQMSFTIDRTSTVPVAVVSNQCSPIASFNFTTTGTKLIGINPNTIKYSQAFTSNGSGEVTINDLEWDTYTMDGTDSVYDIIGTNPLLSLGVPPNTTQNMQIITAPKNGRRLVVVVRDQSTGLPITDATVDITGPNGYSSSITTSQGFMTQTDWSGGSGQALVGDSTMFLTSNGNIETNLVPGLLDLVQVFGSYVSSGTLTSSTFDTGAPSNFRQIVWTPGTQPAQTGLTSVQFQVATNTDNATWNYVGPDGTASTYFTTADQNIGPTHDGDRYLRYKLYMSTADPLFTPTIADVSFTYTSTCVPPGQVSFSSLATGTYTITVSKTGYQSVAHQVTVSSSWQKDEVTIAP